jgi:sugar phosphate isomerase/epimerase
MPWRRRLIITAMRLSFMTLGCPNWTLDDICSKGPAYGFDAVDFRGLGPDLDITVTPAFTTDIGATKRRLDSAGLAVSGVSSSLNICNPEKKERDFEEAKRTIPVALALGAKNIRVFGGAYPDSISRLDAASAGAELMHRILSLPDAASLNWVFETHDEWISSRHCNLLIERVNHPSFGILWDTGHTFRVGGEPPGVTYENVGRHVRYVHVKDATFDPTHPKAMASGWRYMPCGTGQLPLAESIALLKRGGYEGRGGGGYLLCEHEKRWHANLPEPEEMFPAFVKWIRPLIA